MMSVFVEGLFLQASLILALGAQNIFVLETGLKKKGHYLAAFICSLCDVLLIFIGVSGVAAVFAKNPSLKTLMGLLGVGFLLFYGLTKLREVFTPVELKNSKASQTVTTEKIVLLSLSFSLLNPHVYLDTIVLIGGYAAQKNLLVERFLFGGGAAFFSIIWFFSLAYSSSALSRFLNNPQSRKYVSFISGIILIYLAWKLGSALI